MSTHRELMKLYNEMAGARDKSRTHFVDTGAVSLAFFCTGIGLAMIGGFTLLHGNAVTTMAIGLFVLAAAFMLSSPISAYFIKKKAKALEKNWDAATDTYMKSLHGILGHNGFKGEYVSLNHPLQSPYFCFAEKDGRVVHLEVTLYSDGLISEVEGQRINLLSSM